jgi:peptide/nickel transport system permease protein
MIRLVALRLVGGVVTLLLVSVLVFASTEALPGDAAQIALGRNATPLRLKQLRAATGLDLPPIERYFHWLAGAVHFDFGDSLVEGVGFDIAGNSQHAGEPVAQLISGPLKNTGILVLATLVFLVPLSLLIGVATALKRGSSFDGITQTLTLVFTALPEFTLGAILALIFGVLWPVLPAVSLNVSPATLVLPVMTLTLVTVAYTSRFIRAGLIGVLASDHVQMARMKGLPERLVIRRHVLPNALGPTLQAFALVIGWLAGGVVVVEAIFAYPGLGQGLVTAISARDVPVVQAYVLIIATVYVVANLIADFLTVALNPRLRTTT